MNAALITPYVHVPDRVELVLIRDGVQRISLTPTEEFTRHIADRVRQAMDAAGEPRGSL